MKHIILMAMTVGAVGLSGCAPEQSTLVNQRIDQAQVQVTQIANKVYEQQKQLASSPVGQQVIGNTTAVVSTIANTTVNAATPPASDSDTSQ